MYFRNYPDQPVNFHLLDGDLAPITDGTATVYVTKDDGSQTAGSVGSGAATHKGNGSWQYVPSADEFDANVSDFTIVHSGGLALGVSIRTARYVTIKNQAETESIDIPLVSIAGVQAGMVAGTGQTGNLWRWKA